MQTFKSDQLSGLTLLTLLIKLKPAVPKLPATVDHSNLSAEKSHFNGRSQPARSGADNQHILAPGDTGAFLDGVRGATCWEVDGIFALLDKLCCFGLIFCNS